MKSGRLLTHPKPRTVCSALTLTELMCVLAILSILAALYVPALVRAFIRIRNFLGQF